MSWELSANIILFETEIFKLLKEFYNFDSYRK